MTYKEFAIDLAKQAGQNIRDGFVLGIKKEWKADHTPVTAVDLKNNQLVLDAVAKTFPDHSVLAEEGSNIIKNSKYTWVCDPVDGTVPFSHGIPTCVFSLALVEDGVPVLGVIYDPFLDRMFVAELGSGAFLNGKKISVNKKDLSRGVIAWSNRGMSEVKERFPNLSIICLWCICYEGVLVASGELQACFYNYVNAHDIAALKVIVEEAGGKVTDRFGNEQRYDGPIKGALISNGLVHNQLIEAAADIKLESD